jgi:hypothetical protein
VNQFCDCISEPSSHVGEQSIEQEIEESKKQPINENETRSSEMEEGNENEIEIDAGGEREEIDRDRAGE